MNSERYSRQNKCTICLYLFVKQEDLTEKACEKYLLKFLIDLQDKLDDNDEKKIDEHFINSMFDNQDQINQTSCQGLTLMHVNLLGGQDESEEEENSTFIPAYDDLTALRICQILLKRGASSNGNTIYEMRPLHIAIRREWTQVTRVLLEAGANPNMPEKDMYASRPMDIAVLNDDSDTIGLLHMYGASLNGFKTMFHLPPLAEAFVRGYFDVYNTLLKLGAKPMLDLDRNTFRMFGTQLFDYGTKGRRHFIQLLYDHGGDIETQFKLHAIRVEPNRINYFEPRFIFCCDPICIADLDTAIFIKWLCECRSLKEVCRLKLRRHFFNSFNDGFKRLSSLKSHNQLNNQLFNYIMFNK